MNTNWLIIKRMQNYGYYKEATSLAGKTLELLLKSGFYEYFNPHSGEGYGASDFSWSAALALDLIESHNTSGAAR